jgi:hypothetical protein
MLTIVDDGVSGNCVCLCRNCAAKRQPQTLKQAGRRRKEFEAIGYPNAACLCGETDLRVLELNHVAGSSNSDFQVPMCKNHHAAFTVPQVELAAELLPEDQVRGPLSRQAAFEVGLALLLLLIAILLPREAGAEVETTAIFLMAASAALLAWACWNRTADQHIGVALGQGWWHQIKAEIPP